MAGGGGGSSNSRELDQTPTWAVSAVVAIIIVISIVIEEVLHLFGEWLTKRRKKALYEALQKVKAELMILGFISLILTFGQSYISRICIPEKVADTMLPCSYREETMEEDEHHRRRLFQLISSLTRAESYRGIVLHLHAKRLGRVPLVSVNGLHQLHIFIFFLAVFHVAYSVLTMALGRAKIRGWKEWEKETSSLNYEFSNDPARFRFAHELSFVRKHSSFWATSSIFFYVLCFFRHIFRSVGKADYLILRHGFITAHLAPGSKFNFQQYIKRSLEDDFKSCIMGFSYCLLFLNVSGWQGLFWISLIPLIIILAVGTKLQAIISKMALEIKERHAVIQGIPLVQLSDKHFWFGRPHLILSLLHFTLFQNAFQIIYFFWIWYEFGLRSCFHKNFKLIITRVFLGVVVQFTCSYITLPLYALVTQMGSHMKRSIFDEQTTKALKKWRQNVKKKQDKPTQSPNENSSGSPRASPNESPIKTTVCPAISTDPKDITIQRYLDKENQNGQDEQQKQPQGEFTSLI